MNFLKLSVLCALDVLLIACVGSSGAHERPSRELAGSPAVPGGAEGSAASVGQVGAVPVASPGARQTAGSGVRAPSTPTAGNGATAGMPNLAHAGRSAAAGGVGGSPGVAAASGGAGEAELSAAGAGAAGAGAAGAGAAGAGAAGAGAAGGGGGSGRAAGAAGSVSTDPGKIIADPVDDASYLFDQNQLRTYNVVIAENDLATLNQNPSAEAWVPASLEFEGKSYGPYRVRYKGSAGAFMYPCTSGPPGGPKTGKCSLKLGFNEVDAQARFFGLKKLNFHSMNADVSMLRDRLGYRMFREMGIAAPRSAHARVLINGKLEGLFAVVEQIDGRFTRSRFSEGGQGNLYKEVWPQYDDAATYLAALETNQTPPPSVQRMLDFKAAIDQSAAATASHVDLDYLQRYIAVDRVIVNDDGVFRFWCDPSDQGHNPGAFGNHNYYWYEATHADRLWLIPWDLDNSFDNTEFVHIDPEWTAQGECACHTSSLFGTQRPSSCDPLVQRFIGWRSGVDRAVDAFLAGPFARSHVDALLDAWTTQVRAAVVESAGLNYAPTEAQWADDVLKLKATIESARQHRGYAY